MDDKTIKEAIVQKRWRVWFRPSPTTIDKWVVQRRNWYGGWSTIGRFWTESEALQAKETLMREDVKTFRGSLEELK